MTGRLIDRLEGVKETGPGRWIARCPAHDDRSPSLSIRELDDGRILIHDFGGCGGPDVMDAVGLTLSDLYPEPIKHHAAPRPPNHWHSAREAFLVLRLEVLLVAVAAENIVTGISLTGDDRDRLILAARRIRAAGEAVQ